MRLGLPQMVVASLALHGGVVAGISLAYFHVAPASVATLAETTEPTLILLRSEETPDFHPFLPSRSAAAPTATASVAPSRPVTEKKSSVVLAPSPSLALEANPNVHVRALPPEAILSPSHAPHLDGRNGVVFLLDISGSMYEPYAGSTRLALAREELSGRIRALKDGTPFAITLYGESARTSGPLVAASDATREAAVRYIMQDVDCGGGTNVPAGLVSAEELQPGHLVLVSDGDLNIGLVDLMTQARQILGPKGRCPELSAVGICPRPETEAEHLLQCLAEQEGGTYQAEQFDGTELLTADRR